MNIPHERITEGQPVNYSREEIRQRKQTYTTEDFYSPGFGDEDEAGRQFRIQQAYAQRLPEILRESAEGFGDIGFLHWEFRPHALLVLQASRLEGIVLYPQYPFLSYFLDFADPYRKIALLVEEGNEWDVDRRPSSMLSSLLQQRGWRVFKIPSTIIGITEADLLPDGISSREVYLALASGPNDLIVRRDILETASLEGFFRFLKEFHFSPKANEEYRQLIATGKHYPDR